VLFVSVWWNQEEGATYQLAHQSTRREVSLQKGHQIPPREKQRSGKYGSCGLRANRLAEGVETGRGQNKAADVGHIRQTQDCQRDGCFSALLGGIYHHGLLQWCLLLVCPWRMAGILLEVLVVEGAEIVGIFSLVLLDVSLVYPEEGVHEPDGNVSLVLGCWGIGRVHSIQRGRNVAHHSHEEEWHLEDCMLEEVQPTHYALVPGGVVHVDEK
jgi:hypothetical protein